MDLYELDAAYQLFPSFSAWSDCLTDNARWKKFTRDLEARGEIPPELLKQARDVAMRAAAIDTGAIENLYEVDAGFTMTVAMQAATWQAVLAAKGEKIQTLIESQMDAYDYVLDLATQKEPISEVWIRSLHERLCASQETYRVLTEVGWQEHPLPLGEYKSQPNHVRTKNGQHHAYAPVDLVASEMHRLLQELRGDAFHSAHPALQAAYAHYGFVAIHPFADGNGRVARALASVFTYRSHSVPLLILAEHKSTYFSALRAADRGDFQPFVDFAFERAVDAVRLVEESLRAAAAPPLENAATELAALFVTKGGYTHAEVDRAGATLREAALKEFKIQSERVSPPQKLQIQVNPENISMSSLPNDYRISVQQPNVAILITATSAAPATARVQRVFLPLLPKDSDVEDEILLQDTSSPDTFSARLTEVHPMLSTALQMRLRIFVGKVLGELLADLRSRAEAALQKTGYRDT